VSSVLLNYASSDFRDDAARLSTRLLHQRRLPADPADLASFDVSLCLPAPGDPVARRKQVSRKVLINILIPLVFFGAGAFTFGLNEILSRLLSINTTVLSAVGISCGLLGFVGMLSLRPVQSTIVRSVLREMNTFYVPFKPTDALVNIAIENPVSRKKIKLLAEDRANLFCDANRRLIVIEGIFYRYLVHGQDVISCMLERKPPYPFLIIQYRVANTETTLNRAISYVALDAGLKREALSSRKELPLVAVVERTFGFSVPYIVNQLDGASPEQIPDPKSPQ
jgi:hypothetical protein